MIQPLIIHVAVPTPVRGSFDYLPPPDHRGELRAGTRVRVGFGRRRMIGVVVGHGSVPRIEAARLKPILEVLDEAPLLREPLVELLIWASGYYHHPLGEVIAAALPRPLRLGKGMTPRGERIFICTSSGLDAALENLTRAPRQAGLLALLKQHPEGLNSARLDVLHTNWRRAAAGLIAKGLVIESEQASSVVQAKAAAGPAPNADQRRAVEEVTARLGGFSAFLLDGVTGSGKTEVYLQLIEQIAKTGRQTLLLAPEIGLTPQLIERVQQRFAAILAVLHSGLSDGERHRAWHSANRGLAPVVIGTRSAVFAPLARPGLIIVDEEHDLSFKQQEGFRYHARDLAVWRARQLGVPIVLGSATPSLESLYNVEQKKYQRLHLPERAGQAGHPRVEIMDMRRKPLHSGLSEPLLGHIRRHLEDGGQVLLFLNRRGYAPALICHDCGWVAPCPRCDAYLILHALSRRMRCHHCDGEHHIPESCPECSGNELRGLGEGTEQIEQALNEYFPDAAAIRIDRDTTRRRGEMQARLDAIRRGEYRLLIGTQMLSKGHDFPGVTLVGVLNADQGLYGADFRSLERMAQLVVQVAGRAGRAGRPGMVILQTHRPDHPLLNMLLSAGFNDFCRVLLAERRAAELPPYSHLALLRAEAVRSNTPMTFLEAAREAATAPQIKLLGPAPAPMERRAGRHRAQLLLKAVKRQQLQHVLSDWLPRLSALPGASRVRWSIDVDPMELD